MSRTQARIYISNFEHNIQKIKKLAPNKKMCLAVKANAYGHGSIEIAKSAISLGVDYLSVATVAEGIELRKAKITCPILLLSLCNEDEVEDLVRHNLIPLVADVEFVNLLFNAVRKVKKNAKVYPLHLKIDTGMARHGCKVQDALSLAQHIISKKVFSIDGICTHLCVSDSLKKNDLLYTRKQVRLFEETINTIKSNGIDTGIIHCAASGGIILHPDAHFDMVRPGILSYGYFPSDELYRQYKDNKKYNFLPVMEIVSSISAIKEIEKGDTVSYGRTWKAKSDSIIATIPIGYADGLNRRLSGNFSVVVNAKRQNIIGRICMDQCVIDITNNTRVKRWSEVYIFGPKKNNNTAQSIANQLHTIPYEIVCSISARVERVYVTNLKK